LSEYDCRESGAGPLARAETRSNSIDPVRAPRANAIMSDDSAPPTPRLRITEIFHSLQGEARDVGRPTVFVRLTGCPLRCVWCDTAYAFHGGEWRDIHEIVEEVAKYKTRHVCMTGGEPLAQKRCLDLLARLCDAG